jgi:preprotein translocase subunit SecG
MEFIRKIFPVGHFVISLVFIVCAIAILFFALMQLWQGIQFGTDLSINERINAILESIAFLTVAVAALELGQTLIEEEVQRASHISGPTRVRRFLSRFMVVLVVALSIETLVLTFRLSHEAPEQLPYVAGIGLTAAVLLASWGIFIRLNRSAEELEPEGMQEAKQEDKKVSS